MVLVPALQFVNLHGVLHLFSNYHSVLDKSQPLHVLMRNLSTPVNLQYLALEIPDSVVAGLGRNQGSGCRMHGLQQINSLLASACAPDSLYHGVYRGACLLW
jgi:hypothetical protein